MIRAESLACPEGFESPLSKLFDLKTGAMEMGFQISVLAGVFFSDATKETMDRFERGLAF
jgi:hypothetical protein